MSASAARLGVAIAPTEETVQLDGVPCRVWHGITQSGHPILVFVHRVMIDERHQDDPLLAFLHPETIPDMDPSPAELLDRLQRQLAPPEAR